MNQAHACAPKPFTRPSICRLAGVRSGRSKTPSRSGRRFAEHTGTPPNAAAGSGTRWLASPNARPRLRTVPCPGVGRRDLITGAHNKSALATLVERNTPLRDALTARDRTQGRERARPTEQDNGHPAGAPSRFPHLGPGAEMAKHRAFSMVTDLSVHGPEELERVARNRNERLLASKSPRRIRETRAMLRRCWSDSAESHSTCV